MRLAFSSAATIALVASSASAVTFEPTSPGPLGLDSGTQVRGLGSVSLPFAEELHNTVSSGPQTVNEQLMATEFAARADLSLGEVGVLANNTTSGSYAGAFAQSKIFDTLMFEFTSGTSGLISYSVSYDGVLSNVDDGVGSQNTVIAWSDIRIYDVTDVESAFTVFGAEGSLGNSVGSTGTLVSQQNGGLALVSPGLEDDVADGSYGIGGATEYQVDGSGVPVSFSGILSDTFTAEEGRIYALLLSSDIWPGGDQSASGDMLNSAAFEFINLSGVTVYSASGVLPGTQAASVIPLPAPLMLLLGGLGALFTIPRLTGRRAS